MVETAVEELREYNPSYPPPEIIQTVGSLLELVLQKSKILEQVDLRGIHYITLKILQRNKPASLKIVKVSCLSSTGLKDALNYLSQYEEIHLDVQFVDE